MRTRPATILSYGADRDQWLSVVQPTEPARGTVALIHGGFWRAPYGAELMDRLALDLQARGWLVANLEYRRVDPERPVGYPTILLDVVHALEALHRSSRVALIRPLVLVGHSAGGQLALWAASSSARTFAGRSGVPRIDAVVSQAGVVDLHAAARARLGRDAVRALLGGSPTELPARYARCCPLLQLPLGIPQLLVHGRDDEHVPWQMSERYVARALSGGDAATAVVLEGVGHFEHLDPSLPPWRRTVEWIEATVRPKLAQRLTRGVPSSSRRRRGVQR